MGFKINVIEEEQPILLHIHANEQQMDFQGILKKHVKENIAVIDIVYTAPKRLVFDHVIVDLEYSHEQEVPLLWRNIKVVPYGEHYAIQAAADGVRNNRRNSFRLAIAQTATFRMEGRDTQSVMIRDISLSGFAISDRKKELNLSVGDNLSISFEDWGYKIALNGTVVRVEEREDMIIYGCSITNMCNDLSPYMSTKQRRNKNHG